MKSFLNIKDTWKFPSLSAVIALLVLIDERRCRVNLSFHVFTRCQCRFLELLCNVLLHQRVVGILHWKQNAQNVLVTENLNIKRLNYFQIRLFFKYFQGLSNYLKLSTINLPTFDNSSWIFHSQMPESLSRTQTPASRSKRTGTRSSARQSPICKRLSRPHSVNTLKYVISNWKQSLIFSHTIILLNPIFLVCVVSVLDFGSTRDSSMMHTKFALKNRSPHFGTRLVFVSSRLL